VALRHLIFSALAITVTTCRRCISLLSGGPCLLQDDATRERKRGEFHSLPSLALLRKMKDALTDPVKPAEVLCLRTEDDWRSSDVQAHAQGETPTLSTGFIFIMIKPGNYILLSSYSLKK
jgi:hypothetical protein